MFRFMTKVITSPTALRRSSSATSATPGGEQLDDLVLADLLAREHSRQHLSDGPARAWAPAWVRHGGAVCRQEQGRVRIATRAPVGIAREALGIGPVHHRMTQTGCEESRVSPLRVDREARGEHVSVLLGHLAQSLERRPGALGIDMVGRHR
jgi:hypothetical protein